MDPHRRAPKKNTSHGNEVLPQDTTHLIQRPCYQRGSPCQDPAGNWTTRSPLDGCKETQTAVVWSCFRSSGLAKSILQGTVKGGRRQRKRWEDNIREWTGQEFAKFQRAVENMKKWKKTGCKVICCAQTTLAVKGLMMMMMMMTQHSKKQQQQQKTTKKADLTTPSGRVAPQDTTHLIQRPCNRRGSPCKIQQAIGPHEDLTIVKRRKLQ